MLGAYRFVVLASALALLALLSAATPASAVHVTVGDVGARGPDLDLHDPLDPVGFALYVVDGVLGLVRG